MIAPFKPAWWLKNPHLQTIWPTLHRRKPNISTYRERLELADGDFIDLDWGNRQTLQHQPIVVLLHGLEGSVNSPYIQGMVQALTNQGWNSVVMHFRGCSGEPNRLPRAYHSGEIDDFTTLLETLQSRHPQSPLMAIGYSLGANMLIRYLGVNGDQTPLQAACAVSPPLHLAACAERMRQGFSQLYQNHLLSQMRKNLLRKFASGTLDNQLKLAPAEIGKLKTFWQFDQYVTAPLHGFAGADDYYQKMSGIHFLSSIKRPTLLIQAKDDPFMTHAVLPSQALLSTFITHQVSRWGGHVGFIDGGTPWQPSYWLERSLPDFLRLQLEKK